MSPARAGADRSTFSAERINGWLATAAKVVELHGEKYLPLFELLEAELEKAERREATLQRVRDLAKRRAA